MNRILAICIVALLAGCGLGETATVAATSAELKAQEAKEAQKTMQQVENRLDEVNKQAAERAESTSE